MRIILSALLVAQQQSLDLTGKPAASIPEPFTKIAGVQELSPTLAVATDNMETKVVLVDFASGAVKQVGAKGDGPNEYRYPSLPIRAPAGAWVLDTYARRALFIARTGAITMTKLLPQGPLSRVRGSDAAGRVYFEGPEFNPETGGFSDTLPVLRWDPATDKVEQIARVWGGGRVKYQREGGGSMAREITPFPHLDAWAPLPDGRLALVRHEPFRIDYAAAGGVITRGSPIPTTPIAITARERDWYRERNTPGRMTAGTLRGGAGGPQRQGPQWDDTQFPATMPAYIGGEVIASPEGEVWIPRSFSSVDKTRKYEIYDGAGKLTGTAIVDANARVVGFGAKSVYVARTNPDDDLVYLMKYRRP